MSDLVLLVLLILGGVLLATAAAIVALLFLAVRFYLAERRDRLMVARRARRAAQAYGLALVPTDEVGRARDRRQGRGAA